ncbi:MAG TPA: GNAT family N-acetyltransferase [Pyrinomonadaceae bacterium]|nr:GNAT family N-acetyltransferase [Pyrinomonadaceae bacterium]
MEARNPMDEIETSRLQLRHFNQNDLDELALIFSDPLVLKYLLPNRAATREETLTALLSMIRHWERHGYGRWAVVHQATDKLIGYGGLRCFDGTPELVYLLARPYWGSGLATEIARGCLEYGFMRHKFERIIALTRPDNLASRRVMEKTGLSYQRHDIVFNLDVVLYALTRDEYLSQCLSTYAQDSSRSLSTIAAE